MGADDMQILSNQSSVHFDRGLISREQREIRRNTEMTVGDNRHTRKMLATDMTHLNATVHLSIDGLVGYYQQQLGNFFTSGITDIMTSFENLHGHVMEKFDGIERDRRIDGLERAFLELSMSFAQVTAISIMKEAGIVLRDDEGDETSHIRRAWNEMKTISSNIFEMLQSTLSFFQSNGSFVGFANTSPANRPSMLSFSDLVLISGRAQRNGEDGMSGGISSLALSNAGRELFDGIVNRDFLR